MKQKQWYTTTFYSFYKGKYRECQRPSIFSRHISITNMSVKRILQITTNIIRIQQNMEKYQKYLAQVKYLGKMFCYSIVIHIFSLTVLSY